jgi:hypothetical protein
VGNEAKDDPSKDYQWDWNRTRGLKPCMLDDDDDDDDADDDDDDRARATIDTIKFEVLMAVTISLVCDTVLWPSRDAVRTFHRNTSNHVPINTGRHNTGDNIADKIMTAHS